jgi:hypothetical protein
MLSVSELRELSQKATQGEWEVRDRAKSFALDTNHWHGIGSDQKPTFWIAQVEGFGPPSHADAHYIVAACNSLPSILDRLEAAEADAKYMRGRESFLERFVLDVYDIVNGEESDAEEKLESIRRRLDNNESDGLDDLRAALSPPKKGE